MELLVKRKSIAVFVIVNTLAIEDITMRFGPGRVMNFRYDKFERLVFFIPAVIKTNRIHAVTEIT